MLRKLMTALMLMFVVVTVASCDSQSGNRGNTASTTDSDRNSDSSRD
jgi:hypothetical protein